MDKDWKHKLKEKNRNERENDELCCFFPRHMYNMKWFSEESKRWHGCTQAAVGVRAQVPVKTFSAAVLPDSSVTLFWFLISLSFAFLKSISLPWGEMHSSIQILHPSCCDCTCISGNSDSVAQNVTEKKKKNLNARINKTSFGQSVKKTHASLTTHEVQRVSCNECKMVTVVYFMT